MSYRLRAIGALSLALCLADPAAAVSGDIFNFGASASQVMEGDTVDFTVSFTVSTSFSSWGGSDLTEPAPQEGYQTWVMNWYGYDSETLTQVTLQAAGQSFTDYTQISGGSYSGGWNFSQTFPAAGVYDISVSGSFTAMVESYSTMESAWRNCGYLDPENPGALSCDSWNYSIAESRSDYTTDGSFGSTSLAVEVLATPVPEAPTWALWAVGLTALGLWRRGRRA